MACSICLDDVILSKGGIRLLCSHIFHEKCIKEWFVRINNNTCPYCRKSELDEYKDLVRRVLIRYGMKNLKKPIQDKDFKPVWTWVCEEKQVYWDYRDIIFLVKMKRFDNLNEMAAAMINHLYDEGYFRKEGNKYIYRV